MRGFSLKPATRDVLNFEKLAEMVQTHDFETHLRVEMGTTIFRDKKTWQLKSKQNYKDYRLTYNKRILLDDYRTVPFGYRSF